MSGRTTDRALHEEVQELERESRRTLSPLYLAEVDRRKKEFLDNPDGRPNSGMREGDIAHGDINDVIRMAEKTVIFGQQTRLRAGILMKEDERLPRFHAGHELVNYFYGAVRLIPEYLLDAIFERGISVTLVKGVDLLIYRGPRCHQSFHTGRTRKTIYVPEGVLLAAFERRYHPWALSEVLIYEAWKLLDYYLIVELARRTQTWMHHHQGIHGFYFVKDTLLSLNKHRRIAGEHEQTRRHRFRRNSKRGQRRQTKHYDEYDATSTDTEFMKFYRHYCWDFYGWGRPGEDNRLSADIADQAVINESDILLRDPYHVANDTFAERRESAWASLKIDAVKNAFGYPEEYQVDRDIVHPVAFDSARRRGQPLEPVGVEDIIHDLRDVARFGVARQTRTDELLDELLLTGMTGIVAFFDAVADEHATGKAYITLIIDDYDVVEELRAKIQELSSTGPAGTPNSVSNDFRDYLAARLLREIADELETFLALPKRDRIDGLFYMRALTLKALQLAQPDLDEAAREEMVAAPAHDFGPSHHVTKLADVAGGILRRLPEDRETDLLFDILRKMDRHVAYRDLLLEQARSLHGDTALEWGESFRGLIGDLRGLVPEAAHTSSSDPAGVRARLNRFDYLRRTTPDSEELLGHLAGVLLRLDRAENYDELVERVIDVGEPVRTALVEIIEQIDGGEERRRRIRDTAAGALKAVMGR